MSTRRTPLPKERFGSSTRAPDSTNRSPRRPPRHPSSGVTTSTAQNNWCQRNTTARTAKIEQTAALVLTHASSPAPFSTVTPEEDDFVAAARTLTNDEREELIDILLEYDDPCEEERWHALFTIQDRHRHTKTDRVEATPAPTMHTPSSAQATTNVPEERNLVAVFRALTTNGQERMRALLADDALDDEELWDALTKLENSDRSNTEGCEDETISAPPLTLACTPNPVQPTTNEEEDEFIAAARMLPDEEREELINALLEYDDPCEEEQWHALYTIRNRRNARESASSLPFPSRNSHAMSPPLPHRLDESSGGLGEAQDTPTKAPPTMPEMGRAEAHAAEATLAFTSPRTSSPTDVPGEEDTVAAPFAKTNEEREELLKALLDDDNSDDEELEKALSDLASDDPMDEEEEWLTALIYGDRDDLSDHDGFATGVARAGVKGPRQSRHRCEHTRVTIKRGGHTETRRRGHRRLTHGRGSHVKRRDKKCALLPPPLASTARGAEDPQVAPPTSVGEDAPPPPVPSCNPGTTPPSTHFDSSSNAFGVVREQLPSPHLIARAAITDGIAPPDEDNSESPYTDDATTLAWKKYVGNRSARVTRRRLVTNNAGEPRAMALRSLNPQVEAPADELAGGDAAPSPCLSHNLSTTRHLCRLDSTSKGRDVTRELPLLSHPIARAADIDQGRSPAKSIAPSDDSPARGQLTQEADATSACAHSALTSHRWQLPQWNGFKANFATIWANYAPSSDRPSKMTTETRATWDAQDDTPQPKKRKHADDTFASGAVHSRLAIRGGRPRTPIGRTTRATKNKPRICTLERDPRKACPVVVEDNSFRRGVIPSDPPFFNLPTRVPSHNHVPEPDTSTTASALPSPRPVFPRYALEQPRDPDELATREQSLPIESQHNAEVRPLMTDPVIQHLVNTATEVVTRTPNQSWLEEHRSGASQRSEKTTFAMTAGRVIACAGITTIDILTALTYSHRIGPHLRIAREKGADKRMRLGAVIIANEYLHDDPLGNVYWAMCTQRFSPQGIGLTEREFLHIVEFSLRAPNDDLLTQHRAVLAPYSLDRKYPANTTGPENATKHRSPWPLIRRSLMIHTLDSTINPPKPTRTLPPVLPHLRLDHTRRVLVPTTPSHLGDSSLRSTEQCKTIKLAVDAFRADLDQALTRELVNSIDQARYNIAQRHTPADGQHDTKWSRDFHQLHSTTRRQPRPRLLVDDNTTSTAADTPTPALFRTTLRRRIAISTSPPATQPHILHPPQLGPRNFNPSFDDRNRFTLNAAAVALHTTATFPLASVLPPILVPSPPTQGSVWSTLDDPPAKPIRMHSNAAMTTSDVAPLEDTPASIPSNTSTVLTSDLIPGSSTSGSTRTSPRCTKTVENVTESNVIEPSCSPGITASAPLTQGKLEYADNNDANHEPEIDHNAADRRHGAEDIPGFPGRVAPPLL